ncbi:hypothetical protein [Achromobacter phage Motura]|uniref:RNA-binding S4 domain-containing protein n=1 Tax=Achromobacter phage Motura TaxID=2591403 RepID=A0A514CTA7_9CAUD|nr:hypothetical protein H1O15_gp267 [Achromobacter phage Motura]QDH83694.1 hypothetical protein [Achromobacter phage Motura]
MKARDWLAELNKQCQFGSREQRGKKVTRAELQRWLDQKAVLINGETVKQDEELDFPIISVVLHPASKHRTTIW